MTERATRIDLLGGERWILPGKPRLSVYSSFAVEFFDYAHSTVPPSTHDARVQVTWSRTLRRYVAERFEAVGTADDPVTAESIRGVPIAHFIEWACEVVPGLVRDDNGRDMLAPDYYALDALTSARERGPDGVTLALVAGAYRAADVARWKPAYRVAELFGVPPRTASHWVKLARERGHLVDSE